MTKRPEKTVDQMTYKGVTVELRDVHRLIEKQDGEPITNEYWMELGEPGVYWESPEWQQDDNASLYCLFYYDREKDLFFDREGFPKELFNYDEESLKSKGPRIQMNLPLELEQFIRNYLAKVL